MTGRISFCVLAALLWCSRSIHAEVLAAAELVRELEHGDHPGIESMILATDGKIVARYVASKLRDEPPDLRSATKSITSLLVGIAIDRGEIPSLQSKVASLLPAYRDLLTKDPRKAAITVEHLLTMRSGLACDDWDPKSAGHEDKMYKQRDWVAFWAKQPMQSSPGERFSYCTGNAIALGAVLEDATGMRFDQYAEKYLFAPLGITSARWARWNKGKSVDAGGHLRMTPEDFLRIGQLVLERGLANGVHIVSEEWISAMTTPHSDIPGQAQQYGYLWWLDRTKSPKLPQTPLWWAQGNGGSLLIVMPGVHSVLAVTATRFNRPDALEPLFWLRDRLLPDMGKR
jgi:CubicO group peptidase (beta-lactamase class C family)